MATTTVTLTSTQAAQLDQLVARGEYLSAEEAVSHSIELLVTQAENHQPYAPEVMAHLRKGYEQALRGELAPEAEIEAFFVSWAEENKR